MAEKRHYGVNELGVGSINIDTLFEDICKYLATKQEYFDIFITLDSRFEGWLEAEILKYIYNIYKQIEIKSTKKKYNDLDRPDLVLKLDNDLWIIELKGLLIGKRRSLTFYLERSAGARKDFTNLSSSDKNFWIIMALAFDKYKNLDESTYQDIFNRVSKKYGISIKKKYSFLTPEQKRVKIILWGKE